jgi:outer membrane protein assembly factor BamA
VAVDLLFNEEQQERNFRIQRSGGGAGVNLRLGSSASADLGYKAQLRTLYDIDPGVIVPGDAWLDELGVSDLEDPSPVLPSASRWASGISANFVLDLRDDVYAPTRGGIGSIALDVNDDLLSDIAFLRAEGGWTQLFPVAGTGFVLRARGGAIVSSDDSQAAPIEDRLRAGGGGSFRGFEVDTLGPANHVSSEDVDWPDAMDPILRWSARSATGRWVPTGGDAMGVGTAELDIPLSRLGLSSWRSWQLALFSDFGNVWWINPLVETDSMRRGEDPLLRYAVGLGIRRSTPIGPLQLDLGFNPSPLDYRGEVVFPHVHFAVGAL